MPDIVTPVVKTTPLLACPPTVTITGPVVAPDGTGATMLEPLHDVGAAETPLNVTVLVPRVVPKFAPVIVTDVPTGPEVGVSVLTVGVGNRTVKLTPLLATPLAFTTTFPLVALDGTGATMLVALQLVGVAAVPLNLTVPLPWVEPKLDPVIVTEAPTTPDVGERLLMFGAGTTAKLTPLLDLFETVTTTFPVVAPVGTVATMLVALQLVAVAVVPLNLTVLVPWVEPKFVPVIVTEAPTAPEDGDKFEMVGAAAWATPARKKKNETERKRIGFQSRTFIRNSLHGFAVGADQPSSVLTSDKLSAVGITQMQKETLPPNSKSSDTTPRQMRLPSNGMEVRTPSAVFDNQAIEPS
jgi:hypothetical protein